LFGGAAGGGKSWWICEKRLVRAYQYPGIRAFIGRKELKRLMQSTFVTWTKVCAFHKIPPSDWHLNGQYNYIEFKNGSRIDLLDVDYLPSDPLYERFGSLEYTEGDGEEVGEWNELAFEVLKSRVGRHLNKEYGILPKIGLTANPSKNFLYRLFYKPWKEGTLPPEYAFIPALYNDNPFTGTEYGDQLAQIKDQATRQRLMFGNWEYDDDPSALIEYDAILDLFSNTAEASDDKYMTVDVARFGNDKTVIGLWNGLHCYKVYTYTKQGTEVTETRIKELARDHGIPYSHIIIDEDGIGGGIVDHIKGVKGFVANLPPIEEAGEKPNYQHLKSQCYYTLADLVNLRRLAITTEGEQVKQAIVEELEQVKSRDADKDGKLKVLQKDEIKEQLGRSPDYADMLMMRMFFELNPAKTHKAKQWRPNYAKAA
jgi:hypothetical protein